MIRGTGLAGGRLETVAAAPRSNEGRRRRLDESIDYRALPMPIPSPFHPRTSELCTSLRWKDWAGYHAVCSYDTGHEREYFAFRHAAGLMDVTPLLQVRGDRPGAAAFLSRVMAQEHPQAPGRPGRLLLLVRRGGHAARRWNRLEASRRMPSG